MKAKEVKQLMKEMDADGSGNIDFDEFKTLMADKRMNVAVDT